jgi:hypothetical protein
LKNWNSKQQILGNSVLFLILASRNYSIILPELWSTPADVGQISGANEMYPLGDWPAGLDDGKLRYVFVGCAGPDVVAKLHECLGFVLYTILALQQNREVNQPLTSRTGPLTTIANW